MAKAATKAVTATAKKSESKPKAAPKAKASVNIEKISEDVLAKLKLINAEQQLQADLEWCLGSYRYDQNPTGLVEAIGKAHGVLKDAHAKKVKGITTTLLSSIEKVLN